MAHVKTDYGFWYPQNVSAGGDKVDAKKMFVDNIKLLDTMFKSTIAHHNSISRTDLDTIFDYGVYKITDEDEDALIITGGNIQVEFTLHNGVFVRVYDNSTWSDWYSHSDVAITIANQAWGLAYDASNILIAQDTTPTSIPQGEFVGVWEE